MEREYSQKYSEKKIKVQQPRKYVCKWIDPKTGIVCGQGFNERANLKVSTLNYFKCLKQVHRRGVHQKVKPYKCSICLKTFSVIGNRNDHVRRHLKVKPYNCPVAGCTHSYFRKYQLVYHGRSRKHRHIHPEQFRRLMDEMETTDLSLTKKSQPSKVVCPYK